MEIKTEVFSVGKWNGMEFNREDLNLMTLAFDKLKENHKVPLKFGHNDEQPFTDGQPALGWVTDLSVEGDKLIATMDSVPDVVFSAITNKLYRHVSIELDFGVEHKGDYYPFVLSGVALLGADIPAVNNIGDLTKYMARELKSSKRAVFTASNKSIEEDSSMDSKEMQAKLDAMQAQLEASNAQIADLAKEKANFERTSTDLQAKLKIQEDEAKKVMFDRKKTDLTNSVESLVKEKKITPAQRELFMAQYKEDDSTIEMMESNLKVLSMFSVNADGESGENSDKDDEGKTPDVILLERTKKYQLEKACDFSTARIAVMEADKELALEYITMT